MSLPLWKQSEWHSQNKLYNIVQILENNSPFKIHLCHIFLRGVLLEICDKAVLAHM